MYHELGRRYPGIKARVLESLGKVNDEPPPKPIFKQFQDLPSTTKEVQKPNQNQNQENISNQISSNGLFSHFFFFKIEFALIYSS